MAYSIVTTATASAEQAEAVVTAVLAARLAACIQVSDIQSHYVWKGSLEKQNEKLLTMKTRSSLVPQLMAEIRLHHPYELPEILELPITSGLPEYMAWIDESTAEPAKG